MSRRAVAGSLLGGAALVAVVTLVARVAGFGRWLAFSATVGAQCVGEAYQTANQVPNVLFEVVAGGALAGAVVPLLAGPLARSSPAEVDRIASALLTWSLTVLLPATVLLALLSGPIVRVLLADSACPGQHALAARLLVVFAPQVLLYGAGVVLGGVLQAHRRFFWPAFTPLLSSLVVVLSYLAFSAVAAGAQDGAAVDLPTGAEAVLAWGTTAGVAALTLPLLVPAARAGVRLRPAWRFPPGVGRRAARLAGAGLVALVAQQVSVLVVVWLANSSGETGAVNVYTYAQALYLLPYAVLAVPLATVSFPLLAETAATGDAASFAHVASRTTRAVLLVSVAGAAVLVAAAPAVVLATFGALDRGDVTRLPATLVAMAPGLVGFGLVAHLGRALYALERGRAAAGAIAAGWLGVTVAAVALVTGAADHDDSGVPAVVALGAANTIGMTVAGCLLLVALAACAGRPALSGVGRTLAVALLAAGLAVVGGRLATDGVLAAVGTAVPGALAAAVAGVAVTVTVLASGVAAGDSGTARDAAATLRRRRVPR